MSTKTRLRTLLGALALFAATAATAAPVDAPTDPLEAGRTLTTQFLEGDTAAVWARFDDRMKAAMDEATLADFREQVGAQLGEEQAIISEDVRQVQGLDAYVRVADWSKLPSPAMVQWVFGPDGRVAGFVVRPAEATP